MRQRYVQAGPLAGLAGGLLVLFAMLAGVLLAGVAALTLGFCALAARLFARLRAPHGVQPSGAYDDGLVIEGSYVVLDEKPRHATGRGRGG